MNEEVKDVSTETLDSSPKADDSPAASSTAKDATVSESSAEGAQEKFDQRVAELEGGSPAKKEDSPTSEKKPESEAAPDATAKKDEPADAKDKAADTKALSQATQDEALNKAFDERPEWKKALSLVPKEKAAEMREAMRTVLGREKEVAAQVEEKFKPVVQKFERFRKSVGDDQAVENTIALTELFQRGDPKAREMLVTLLNDLDARTGSVLTSKDLVDRSTAIQKQFDDGLITKEAADQKKADLLEIQKARVGQRQSETQVQQRQQEELRQRFQQQQNELANVGDAWDAEKRKSDPDYSSLKSLVESRALAVGTERQQQKPQGVLISGVELRQILDESLTWAKAEAAKLRPAPTAKQPITGTGSSATSRRAATNPKERFNQRIEELESKM